MAVDDLKTHTVIEVINAVAVVNAILPVLENAGRIGFRHVGMYNAVQVLLHIRNHIIFMIFIPRHSRIIREVAQRDLEIVNGMSVLLLRMERSARSWVGVYQIAVFVLFVQNPIANGKMTSVKIGVIRVRQIVVGFCGEIKRRVYCRSVVQRTGSRSLCDDLATPIGIDIIVSALGVIFPCMGFGGPVSLFLSGLYNDGIAVALVAEIQIGIVNALVFRLFVIDIDVNHFRVEDVFAVAVHGRNTDIAAESIPDAAAVCPQHPV